MGCGIGAGESTSCGAVFGRRVRGWGLDVGKPDGIIVGRSDGLVLSVSMSAVEMLRCVVLEVEQTDVSSVLELELVEVDAFERLERVEKAGRRVGIHDGEMQHQIHELTCEQLICLAGSSQRSTAPPGSGRVRPSPSLSTVDGGVSTRLIFRIPSCLLV